MSKTPDAALQAIREYQQRLGAQIAPESKRPGTLARVWGRADCLHEVTLLDGRNKGETETLGGVESDRHEYISEQAHELARELLSRVVTHG